MRVVRQAALRGRNALALPARAKLLATIGSAAERDAILSLAASESLAVIPLGEGSNIVLAGDVDIA